MSKSPNKASVGKITGENNGKSGHKSGKSKKSTGVGTSTGRSKRKSRRNKISEERSGNDPVYIFLWFEFFYDFEFLN